MTSGTILVLSAALDIFVVFFAMRLGIEWLYGTIALNLLLISIFGSQFISVFGFITNAGNVFYACVFFATHLLLERKELKFARRTIWFGAAVVLTFITLSQTVLHLTSAPGSEEVNEALTTLFTLSPRIALASILAYVFAQEVNISLYSWIRKQTGGRLLWFRSNGANIVAQLVDSSIFFTVGFVDLPGTVLVQAILIGTVVKIFVVMLGTPLLYIDADNNKRA
jgi:uncharacterized integral membrane protein (TIGR00697 family)